MDDAHAREEAELDRLLGERERTGDDGLGGDDGGQRGERHERVVDPARAELEERVVDRGRVREQQRALAEVVQHQGREHDREPREPDRCAPEMAEVGVHRLAAGDRQEGCAQHGEADRQMRGEKVIDGAERVQGRQDLRLLPDAGRADGRDGGKPQQHDRSEQAPDEAGTFALDREQTDQDDDGSRHHKRRHAGGIDLQALDS